MKLNYYVGKHLSIKLYIKLEQIIYISLANC